MKFFKNFIEKRKLFKSLDNIDFNTCDIVILTGAGISQESGLNTFRDQNGTWENHNINEVCRPEAFNANPALVLDFYNQRRADFNSQNIQPNKAHIFLKKLEEKMGNRLTVITQNIDTLHEIAGSQNVIHVHGLLNQNKCETCNFVEESSNPLPFPNVCARCNAENRLRPNIVFFKESLHHTVTIEKVLNRCNLLISIGSSGQVYPVAYYPSLVQDQGGLTVCLNKEFPSNDAYFNHIVTGKATDLVSDLVSYILQK
jgi:NAD-dependent deacetylase